MKSSLSQQAVVGLIRAYQLLLSPVLHLLGGPGSGCRFQPSCSAYAIEAVRDHGVIRGLGLSVKRLLRCHPWGGHGFDPVPPAASCPTAVSERDRRFMRRAIALASMVSEDAVSPNPRVGALIVESGEVVAEGFHSYDGGPHAERVALENLGRLPKPGAEMFVTLEPCSTTGRTGSCCERIINSRGIGRVVIGCLDPNPAHAGRALELLGSHGIAVVWGVESAACEALNPQFSHQMQLLADNLHTAHIPPSGG